jgi:hypothetical protein
MFDIFEDEDVGVLRFSGCSRYRLGPTNDEGWNRGQCRYSRLAPAWGEFYEIFGDDRLRDSPSDWIPVGESSGPSRHFLFYLRDEAFEAIANDWRFDTHERNALLKLLR